MKKHSFLLSFCSVLSMFVLLHVLFSCSNQQAQTEDVSEAEASEIISEEGSADSPSEASIESESTESKQAQMSELESTISADETADAETSLGDAPAAESTEKGAETAAVEPPAAEESLGSISAADDEEQQTSLSDLNPTTTAPGFEENLGSAETIPEPAGEVPQQPIGKASKKPRYVGAPSDAPRRAGGGFAKAPTIPGKAFEKNGVLLNRFYFARQGDNAKKVSLLVYGDATKTKSLAAWNKGGFSAGKLIFYNSPVNPNDQKIQSFYQERNIPFESHTVGPKETLGSIAKSKLGATGSWKEIAVLNGLEKFNSAQPGQKLEINPKDLLAAAGSAPKQQASNPTPQPQPTQVAQATPAPNVGEPPPVVDTPNPPAQNAVSSSSSDVDYGNLLTQNLFPIVVGGAVLVFLILLIAIGKRKKKAGALSEDFPEDGFSAPPKLKKRK